MFAIVFEHVSLPFGASWVDESVAARHTAAFPAPTKLWTIADLGGWKAVDADLFDKDKGAIAVIYSQAKS